MNRIKQLREERGQTQSQLGDMVGMSQQAISQYERESVEMTASTLMALCEYFDVSAEYMLCRTEVRQPFPAAENLAQRETASSQFKVMYNLYMRQDEKLKKMLYDIVLYMEEKRQGKKSD